jgi:hypothetical protein
VPGTEAEFPAAAAELAAARFRLDCRRPFSRLVCQSEREPARILLANYDFRAIAVQPGKMSIELRYIPVGFGAGLAISLISLAVAIALVAMERRILRSRAAKQISLRPYAGSLTLHYATNTTSRNAGISRTD